MCKILNFISQMNKKKLNHPMSYTCKNKFNSLKYIVLLYVYTMTIFLNFYAAIYSLKRSVSTFCSKETS